MAKATSSRGGSSRTQVQVSSLPRELHSAEFEGIASPTEDQSEDPKTRARRANRARHARKCTVCHHKDREFIDQDYLRWLSPKKIAREYAISHQSVVYRHADATGLRTQRRASLRATLENFIEQAESVRATAGSVVAAVRLYAQINDQGQWTPPVKRYIIEHRYTSAAEAASASGAVRKKDGVPPSDTFTGAFCGAHWRKPRRTRSRFAEDRRLAAGSFVAFIRKCSRFSGCHLRRAPCGATGASP